MTSIKRITQVVPQFAPVDGVGDYALNLALWLRRECGVESRFVVCDLRWPKQENVEGFAVEKMTCWSAAELTARLEGGGGDPVLLHYVGYGYQHRGIPIWLAEGLTNWKAASARKAIPTRLVTNFHEIWSFHPMPWKSAFYLSAVQRGLVRRISGLSDESVTSTCNYASRIGSMTQRSVRVVPVASNLPPALLSRTSGNSSAGYRALVFGQTWSRLPTVRKHSRLLKRLDESGMLEEVLILGKDSRGGSMPSPDVAHLMTLLPESRIKVAGQLGSEDAANVFQNADFVLGGHLARDICKSGALMAAFSLGCPVVLTENSDSNPLEVGTHFLSCDGSSPGVAEFLRVAADGGLERVAEGARAWYEKYSGWDILGRAYASLLKLELHGHSLELRGRQ